MSSGKILTTHVGSLVRPPELTPYLSAILEGRPYDQAARLESEASQRDAAAVAIAVEHPARLPRNGGVGFAVPGRVLEEVSP